MFIIKSIFPLFIFLIVSLAAGCSGGNDGNIPGETNTVSVSVADTSIVEGNNGTVDLSFTISLSAASNTEASVDYELNSGTANLNDDYTVAQMLGTIVFPAGTTTQVVTVQVNGDTSVEENETLFISLKNASSNLELGDIFAIGTITNDDINSGGLPLVNISNAQIGEGDAGSTQLGFVVSLSSALNTDVSMYYTTGTSGTATSGDDYAGAGITLVSILAGSTTATINIDIFGDTAFEADETFTVNLSKISDNAFLNQATAIGTILNDDTQTVNPDLPVVSIDNAQVLEGNSGVTPLSFNINLSEASDTAVTFLVDVNSGSASRVDDYNDNTDTFLSIPIGSTTATVTLDIIGDTILEPDETFSVSLTLWAGNVTAGDMIATGTILNDDLPLLTINAPRITEGDAGTKIVNFTASLPEVITKDILFTYSISGGTATENIDFTPVANTIIAIPSGSSSVNIPVEIIGDTDIEADETIVLTLSNVSNLVDVESTTISATIADDDLSIVTTTGQRVAEGDTGTKELTFTINLSKVSSTDVSVDYEINDVRATLNEDFTVANPTGRLTIPQGQLTTSVSITVLGDTQIENDELIWFFVTNVTGVAGFPNGTSRIVASGYIDNDDFPTVTITDTTITEGDLGKKELLFTLNLDGVSSGSSVLTYTLAGTASSGSDYVLPSVQEVSFPFGEVVTTLALTINGDNILEPDETIIVNIQPSANSDIIVPVNTQATGTITNDDPKIDVADTSIMEGNTGTTDMQFIVSISDTLTTDVTFNYEINGVTATPTVDFSDAQLIGIGTIAVGASQTIVTVPVIGDTAIEAKESLRLTITSTSNNVFLGDVIGKGVIVNDDGGNTINLAETGQKLCYSDNGGQLSSCEATGQDGDIQAGIAWPTARITNNADGSLTDTLTGLIWAMDGNIMITKDVAWDIDDVDDGRVTWQHALDYIAKLNVDSYLGFTDWRLPNRNELRSLVNYGVAGPATWLNANEQGFTNIGGKYWSSTTHATAKTHAWTVGFLDGWVVARDKNFGQTSGYSFVLPVRGGQNIAPSSTPKTGQTLCYDEAGASIACAGTGQDGETQYGVTWPAIRFANNNDGSITDNLTELMWVSNTNLIATRNPELVPFGSDGDLIWSAGLDYVQLLNTENYLGYNDWRLPNVVELQSLLSAGVDNQSWLSSQGFSNTGIPLLTNYWSSTSYLALLTGQNAWGINLLTADTPALDKTSRDSFVWPVRDVD